MRGIARASHAIAERVDGCDVEQRIADDDRQRSLDQGQPVAPQHFAERNGDPLVARRRGLESGRLLERDAHIEADRHQDRADEERHAPGPGDERRLAESDEQREEEAGCDEKADRRSELGKHAEPGAPSCWRVLDRNQRRPAPFAAEADALQEAQRREEPGRQHARGRVARQGADQRRRDAHRQHRGDQRRLAPDPVAEMPEQKRSHGAGEKGEAEGEIGVEGLRLRRRFRKEHRAEYQRGGGPKNVEVVELDRRADEARQQDLARPGALGLQSPPFPQSPPPWSPALPGLAAGWPLAPVNFRVRLSVFKRIGAFFCSCASGK